MCARMRSVRVFSKSSRSITQARYRDSTWSRGASRFSPVPIVLQSAVAIAPARAVRRPQKNALPPAPMLGAIVGLPAGTAALRIGFWRAGCWHVPVPGTPVNAPRAGRRRHRRGGRSVVVRPHGYWPPVAAQPAPRQVCKPAERLGHRTACLVRIVAQDRRSLPEQPPPGPERSARAPEWGSCASRSTLTAARVLAKS